MDLEDEKDKLDKRQIEEYKKHPMINFADSINRSTIWNFRMLTKGGCLTRVLTILIIIGVFFILWRCSL
jgi:hypothetical protein